MGGAVVSGGTLVVVVSVGVLVVAVVVAVVDDVVVVADGRVVDDGVLAGLLPLPVANSTRPKMIVAISVTTATPHSARTHGLRYQGEGSSAEPNSSSALTPKLESSLELRPASYGAPLSPTGSDRIG
jgi:hypothetical protein